VPAAAAIPYDVHNSNTATTLTVRGSLDINTAPQLAEEIDRILAGKPGSVLVDPSSSDPIERSGVAGSGKLYKGVPAAGGAITISGAKDQPLAIFKLLRMDKVFNL